MLTLDRPGVYEIKNTVNGKRYVGSSQNIRIRFRGHRNMLVKGNHFNRHLQRSWNVFGEDKFVFKTVLFCPINRLFDFEQIFIRSYKVNNRDFGYNEAECASSSMRGLHHSKETKDQMSLRRRGNKFAVGHKRSADHKEKISSANLGNQHGAGRVLSANHKETLRVRNIGNKYSLGIKQSVETCSKKSVAGLGNKNSLGSRRSKEFRLQLSKIHKLRWAKIKNIHLPENWSN